MRILTINQNTNRHEIRRELKHFKAFSAVDAGITESGAVQLKEVGAFQRLKRAIVGNTDREKQSQDALLKLAEINPVIALALGASINAPKLWSASDLRARLDLPAERLSKSKEDGLFHIQKNDPIGLANLRAEDSDAGRSVRWTIIPKNGRGSGAEAVNTEDGRMNTYPVAEDPKGDELKKLYAGVLQDAINDGCEHIALSPVPDNAPAGKYHSIFESAFSDASIECLLDAIDHARLNPSAPRVTITTDTIPGLADRIKDVDVRRKLKHAAKSPPKESVAAMPPGLRILAPGLGKLPKADSIFHLAGVERVREFKNVRLYHGDPHRLAAETMILQFDGLRAASAHLASQGFTHFNRVHDMIFDQERLLGKEASEVMADSRKAWGIDAIAIPSCEIGTSRLFGTNLPATVAITAAQAEKFFLDHLQAAKGRMVIDLPEHADGRKGLLDAIRKFKNSDPGRNAEIVLATANAGIYRSVSSELNQSGKARAEAIGEPVANVKKPPAGGGIHFLNNSPFKLQADRLIVPLSLARSARVDFVREQDGVLSHAPVPGRFIGFDDEFMNSPPASSPEKIKERFAKMLGNVNGTVVICPPRCEKDQLDAIVLAAHEACDRNRQLSVSFAVDNQEERDRLTRAYGRVMQTIAEDRDLSIDGTDEDELVITTDTLWKTAE